MRKPFLLLILVVLAASVPGCTTRDDSEKIILTYTRWGDPAEMDSTKELIAQFETENPDIEVRVDVVSWGQYWQKMKASVSGRTAQDVWLMSPAYVEQYAGPGHLKDLMPFIRKDPAFNVENYFPGAFDAFCYSGTGDAMRGVSFGTEGSRLYAFTRDYNTSALYYNRDHFDEEGLPYPDGTWTRDDLVRAAKQLTKDRDGDGVIDQWGYGGLNYLMYARSIGGSPLNVEDLSSNYTSPEMVDAIGFCHDLMHRYEVHPPPEINMDESANFVTGKVSMMLAGSWMVRSYNRSKYLWDIAPVPLVDPREQTRYSAGGGMGHCVYEHTRYPEESWKLVKFLSDGYSQRELAKSGTSIPVLKSAAWSDDFLAPFGCPRRESLHVFWDTFKGPRHSSDYAKGYLQYSREIQKRLDILWRDPRGDPAAACRDIDKSVDAVLDEQYGRTSR